MKNTAFAILTAAALCACDNRTATTTPEDYAAVKAAMHAESAPGIAKDPVIKIGDMKDILQPIQATAQLKAIYQKKKTAKFWSIKLDPKSRAELNSRNPYAKAKQEYCLLNIMLPEHMEKNGWKGNPCDVRLFCGSIDDINYDEYYAVELCWQR